MFEEIHRYFELSYTTHQKKHTETYSERCDAIDTSDDSDEGSEQYEGPGSDIALVIICFFHRFF